MCVCWGGLADEGLVEESVVIILSPQVQTQMVDQADAAINYLKSCLKSFFQGEIMTSFNSWLNSSEKFFQGKAKKEDGEMMSSDSVCAKD